MNILKTLGNEETSVTDKLTAVKDLVTKVRTKYGNIDKVIEPVKVPTTNGFVPISLLTDGEKVEIAGNEIREIVAMTTAIIENSDGSVFDRVIEGFIAVNPILVNLDMETDSDY